MSVTETSKDGLKREFAINLSAGEIGKRMDARIAELATEIRMPGFRPGKVPPGIVKMRYGKQLQGEVLQSALDEAMQGIIKDNDLRPASNPALNVSEYEEGGDLKATVSLETLPEIPEIDLKKISVETVAIKISDKEVDQAIEQLAEQNKPTVEVKKARAVKPGDTVVIDFVGKIDGKAFDGGSAEGHSLKIGSNSFIPGFEDGLIGKMSGKDCEIKVTFPKDYQVENLAGVDTVFEVSIKELREDGDIKIDDEFAKGLGLDDLNALKKAMTEQIVRQHQQAASLRIKTSVLDAVDEACGVIEIPQTLYDAEYASLCKNLKPDADDHEHDHDHDHDHDHAVDEGMTADEKADAEMLARRRVRLGMVLTEIGRTNNLQVTDEEKQKAIFTESRRHQGQEQRVIEYFQQNPNAAQQLTGPIFEGKVIDHILSNAKVTEKLITVEELYREDEEKPKQKATQAKAPSKKPAAKAKTAPKKSAPQAKAPSKKPAAKAKTTPKKSVPQAKVPSKKPVAKAKTASKKPAAKK